MPKPRCVHLVRPLSVCGTHVPDAATACGLWRRGRLWSSDVTIVTCKTCLKLSFDGEQDRRDESLEVFPVKP